VDWISPIENGIIAASALASAVILWLTFRSVNDQTEISRKQFEMAIRRQEEPDLTATPRVFGPYSKDDGNGLLTVTVYNCGAIPVWKLKVTVAIGVNSKILGQDFSISLGGSVDIRGAFFLSPQLSPFGGEIICDFETPAGRKFRKRDGWLLYYNREHDHSSSSPVAEILQS
jgi:hypothetical protein